VGGEREIRRQETPTKGAGERDRCARELVPSTAKTSSYAEKKIK